MVVASLKPFPEWIATPWCLGKLVPESLGVSLTTNNAVKDPEDVGGKKFDRNKFTSWNGAWNPSPKAAALFSP